MRKIFIISMLLMSTYCSASFADSEQMKQTLAQIAEQLEAIRPLINQAQQEQSENPRVKIHFNSWTDANGVTHAGLSDDIKSIQYAVVAAINRTPVDPRTIKPLSNDFVDSSNTQNVTSGTNQISKANTNNTTNLADD